MYLGFFFAFWAFTRTGLIKAFTRKSFLSLELFHADERLQKFYKAYGSKLIFSMRLDVTKQIQSVKSVWSVLYSEFKFLIILPLEGNNERHIANMHSQKCHMSLIYFCLYYTIIIYFSFAYLYFQYQISYIVKKKNQLTIRSWQQHLR